MAAHIWRKEKLESAQRALQCQASDQKYCQHHIGKRRCHIHGLEKIKYPFNYSSAQLKLTLFLSEPNRCTAPSQSSQSHEWCRHRAPTTHKRDTGGPTTAAHHPLLSLDLCSEFPCTRNSPLGSFPHTLKQVLTEEHVSQNSIFAL